MSYRILVVEDEGDIAELIEFNLTQAGYSIVVAKSGAAALAEMRHHQPDLVVLDLTLPDVSGIEVCRRIRRTQEFARIPIVMVTARGEEMDRVVGFQLGADDYVVKPFSPRELVLRIEAILRRSNAPPDASPRDVIQLGALRLDVPRHRATVDEEEIPLTSTEFKLLHDLVTRRGRVQSRAALLERVWGYDPDMETRTVDTHVKRLREKLGKAGDYLETIRGVGYRVREDLTGKKSS